MVPPYIVIGVRVLLGVIFSAAVASKVARRSHYSAFRQSLTTLPLLPARWSYVLAPLSLAAEALCIILVVIPATQDEAFVLAAIILSAYTSVLLAARLSGSLTACHCFTSIPISPISAGDIARNVILIMIALVGIVMVNLEHGLHVQGAYLPTVVFSAFVLGLMTVKASELSWLLTALFGPTARARGHYGTTPRETFLE